MFKWTVEYLVSFGAMTIHDKIFECRAWTPIGAWLKFLKKTKSEDHYSCESYRYNYLGMRKDIKFCGLYRREKNGNKNK